MKKIFLILIILSILFYFVPQTAHAGIVPCGRPDDPATPKINESTDDPGTPANEGVYCQFCHIFVLFKNIIDFLIFPSLANPLPLVLVIAILMIAIGGFMFMFSAENPSTLAQGKALLKYTGIGLIIIYGAWVVINLFFVGIGVATWTGLIKGWKEGWFEIICPITP